MHMGSYFMLNISFIVLVIIVHYAFYTNTILIIWCYNEDEDEGERNCHTDCDKGSYTMILLNVYAPAYRNTLIHTYTHNSIISHIY